jgi:hypothetical protein
MLPVMADIVFGRGGFYLDLGAGVSWLLADASVSGILDIPDVSVGTLLSKLTVKAGIGTEIELFGPIGLDLRISLYLPLVSAASGLFGETDGLLGAIALAQLCLGAGISLSL